MLKAWERSMEKGIDLVLGLDVLEMVLTNRCDVAIVVSLDRDLYEIPLAVTNLQKLIKQPWRIEAAVPVPDAQKQPKRLPRFAFTHQITRDVFELVRDDTRYDLGDEEWKPPQPPLDLPAVEDQEPPIEGQLELDT